MRDLLKPLVPLLLSLALLAIIALGLHLYHSDGYAQGYDAASAKGEAALADLRRQYASERQAQAEAGQAAAEQAAQRLAAEVQRGNDLALALDAKKAALRATTERLTGEIARVTTLYRRALDAPPEPLPAAVLTVGFGRLWNEALGIASNGSEAGLSASAAPGRADAPASGAPAPDDLASTLTPALLLANHIRNGEGYTACRDQLNALIDYWTPPNGRR
ncbi:hypothetical protein NS383_18920 [Pseudomonas oryzihabitans]|nr:hypothetical protein NS383_18920 [Pseudomonas psychrotolerans]